MSHNLISALSILFLLMFFFIGPFFNVRFIVNSVAVVLTLNVFYKMIFLLKNILMSGSLDTNLKL